MAFSRTIRLSFSFVAALLLSVMSGTQYLFSAYGPALAQRLQFSSVQINTIASAANYGIFLCNPLFGYTADIYGPTRTIWFAASTLFISFMCLALTYDGTYLPANFWLCVVYLFFTGVASAAGMMAVLTTQAKNYPTIRGIALGVPLAMFGLSAYIFSEIETHFFHSDTFHFLIFLALSIGICEFIASWFLVVQPPPSPEECNDLSAAETASRCDQDDALTSICSASSIPNEQSPLLNTKKHQELDIDISGWDLFFAVEARFLVLTLFFLGGAGLMYINNVGSIIKSLYLATEIHPHLPESDDKREILQSFQNYHVSLISIGSCFGRLSTGFFSDVTKNVYNFRRLWFLILSGLYMFAAQIIAGFFITHLENLWIASALVGLGFGTMFGIAPTISSEWFGLRHFGLNWGFLSYATAVGGQIFNLTFGYNYDMTRDHCHGSNCYDHAFWFTSCGCLISLLTTTGMLWYRIKKDTT